MGQKALAHDYAGETFVPVRQLADRKDVGESFVIKLGL